MSDIQREQRKNEHVEIAMAQQDVPQSDFDRMRFVHHSIPNINVNQVDLTSHTSNFDMTFPLYINAMTGGSDWTKTINEKLAVVARETGLAMAVGSTHAALRNPKMAESFSIVRKTNPEGIIFSNVGADVPVDKAVKAVELLDAQALQVHVNAPQELVMPEGNREFSTWLENVEAIVQRVSVPVIIKEVGFGMSKELLQSLVNIGVTYVESLLESISYQDKLNVFASGGLRTPLDAIKSLALGAKAVGMSRPFLNQVEHAGITSTIEYVESFIDHMKSIMTMLDAKDINDLKQSKIVFDSKLMSWIEQRHLKVERG